MTEERIDRALLPGRPCSAEVIGLTASKLIWDNPGKITTTELLEYVREMAEKGYTMDMGVENPDGTDEWCVSMRDSGKWVLVYHSWETGQIVNWDLEKGYRPVDPVTEARFWSMYLLHGKRATFAE